MLPLLPEGAAEIAPGVGVLAGEDGGGLVTVHELATFAQDAGDEAGRRLAAVQLVRLRAASQGQVAAAFGVDPATVWRWDKALAGGGVAGLVPARRGPKGASKLTPGLAARIAELDAAGMTLRQIAAAAGVSTFSVRSALGRVAASRAGAGGDDVSRAAQPGQGDSPDQRDDEAAAAGGPLPLRGLRAAQERVLRAGRDAADPGVPGPGRRAPGRRRHPGAARRAGPGAWPGPGAGGQDDPPQARRARRRREGV